MFDWFKFFCGRKQVSNKKSSIAQNNPKAKHWPDPEAKSYIVLVRMTKSVGGKWITAKELLDGKYDQNIGVNEYDEITVPLIDYFKVFDATSACTALTYALIYNNPMETPHLLSIIDYDEDDLIEYFKNDGELSTIIKRVYDVNNLSDIEEGECVACITVENAEFIKR